MPAFIGFLIMIQGIFILAHWFVFQSIIHFLKLSGSAWFWSLGGIFAIGSIAFIGASVLTFKFKNKFTKGIYVLASYWTMLFYFLFIATILCWILDGNFAFWIFGAAVITAIYSMFNALRLRTATVKVQLKNLPANWRGKKFAWVSDIHLGFIHSADLAEKITKKLRGEDLEFLVVGGDLYDGPDTNQNQAKRIFSELDFPLGKFFITGNHEQFRSEKYFHGQVREFGLQILENELVNLNGLQLIGLDYSSTKNESALNQILSDLTINAQTPAILLKHEPTHVGMAAQHGIALQISGHTHNGQVWPFGLLAKRAYKGFNYGLKKIQDTFVYVSSGAGTWGPPGRLFSRSEVVIFELQ